MKYVSLTSQSVYILFVYSTYRSSFLKNLSVLHTHFLSCSPFLTWSSCTDVLFWNNVSSVLVVKHQSDLSSLTQVQFWFPLRSMCHICPQWCFLILLILFLFLMFIAFALWLNSGVLYWIIYVCQNSESRYHTNYFFFKLHTVLVLIPQIYLFWYYPFFLGLLTCIGNIHRFCTDMCLYHFLFGTRPKRGWFYKMLCSWGLDWS